MEIVTNDKINKFSYELNKKCSVTSLKYMRLFYKYQKSQPVAEELTWSHYQELLPLKDTKKIYNGTIEYIKQNKKSR